MNHKLIDFYTGNGTDATGRTFDDIMSFKDDELEETHDYIQWLFPTEQASKAQPNSPLLDRETIAVLKNNLTFLNRYQLALKKIFDFWGLRYSHRPCARDLELNKLTFRREWMEYGEHNQLRIARVLESTRLLGFENTTQSLFLMLLNFVASAAVHDHDLTAKNVAFWYQAASGNKII